MPEEVRVHYQEELQRLEERALGGLDLVTASLDRTLEAAEHADVELAGLVIADDDRIDGRYLEVHQELITLLATQSPVATDLRLISALLHVMHHIERMGDQCVNIAKLIPLSGNEPPDRRGDAEADHHDGPPVPDPDQPGEAGLRGARRRAGQRPRAPGRRGRQPQPRVLPDRARDRRRPRPARMGDDDAARRPLAGAGRRQRRRHRRAGRLRRDRPLPGVRGRLAPGVAVQAKP